MPNPGFMAESTRTETPELYRSLGRIEGKLDSLATSFGSHLQDDAASFKEVKMRMSSMEYKLVAFIGGLGVIGFLLPIVINHWDIVKKIFFA